jgi:hypothetical protein
MTIARVPNQMVPGSLLPSITSPTPGGHDNAQPCSGRLFRAVEDATIYIATRCHVAMAGTCRPATLSTSDTGAVLRAAIAHEPFTADVLVRMGVTSTAAGNSVSIDGTSYTIRETNGSNFAERQDIIAPYNVGSGDKTDLGFTTITMTMTVASGAVRIWYTTVMPVQTAPGNLTVS